MLERRLRQLQHAEATPLSWKPRQPPTSLKIRGVYALYEEGKLMYIGMSGRGEQLIIGRLRQHKEWSMRSSELAKRVKDPGRIRTWSARAIEIRDHEERQRFEHYAIAILWPPFNGDRAPVAASSG